MVYRSVNAAATGAGEYRPRTRCRNDHDLCRDRTIVPRDNTQHGTRTMYVNGCRCEPCTQVNRVYQLERYHLRNGGAA